MTLEISGGANGAKACALRFQKVLLNLPLAGPVDVAPLMPLLPIMPDTAWLVRSARGNLRVKPSLVDATTGVKNIRLGFELSVTPAAP